MNKLIVITGPCVIEGTTMVIDLARDLKKIVAGLDVKFIFKASYDKANRTSYHSFRGIGKAKGLSALTAIKEMFHIPILSDVHSVEEVPLAASVLDIIQIPALLCRQTDLVVAAARTGKTLNLKKGQFLSPLEMRQVVHKIVNADNQYSAGNKIIITERGTMFGYNNLVVDFRSIRIMKEFGYPVIFDATHAAQSPGSNMGTSGGCRADVPLLAKAGIAAGADGIFLEVHPDPDKALCDGANSLALRDVSRLLKQLIAIRKGLAGCG